MGFERLVEKIGTRRAASRAISSDFAALAEFERSPICERASTGLAAVYTRDRSGERKFKLGQRAVRELRAGQRDPEIQVTDVARRHGVSRTTFYRHGGVVAPRHS